MSVRSLRHHLPRMHPHRLSHPHSLPHFFYFPRSGVIPAKGLPSRKRGRGPLPSGTSLFSVIPAKAGTFPRCTAFPCHPREGGDLSTLTRTMQRGPFHAALRHPRSPSTSPTVFGTALPSTLYPFSVTRTSSSIRMPPKSLYFSTSA